MFSGVKDVRISCDLHHDQAPVLFPSSQMETQDKRNQVRVNGLIRGLALVKRVPVRGGECPVIGSMQAKTDLTSRMAPPV